MASSDAAIEETMEAQDVASDGESVNSDILLDDAAEKDSTPKDEEKKEVVKDEVKTKEKPVKGELVKQYKKMQRKPTTKFKYSFNQL